MAINTKRENSNLNEIHKCHNCRPYRRAMFHLLLNVFTHTPACRAKSPQYADLIYNMRDENLHEFILSELGDSISPHKRILLGCATRRIFDSISPIDTDYDFINFVWY